MIPVSQLNSASKLAIEIAQKFAQEENHSTFGPPHLLMALLNNRVGITSFLTLLDKDLPYLKGWAQYRIEEYSGSGLPSDEPKADEKATQVLDVAKTFMFMFNEKTISPLSILCALTRPEVGFPKGNLGSLRLSEEELVAAQLSNSTIQNAIASDAGEIGSADSASSNEHSPANTKAFLQYCIDKIAMAKQGKIDPIFGRDMEIREMENILCRRTKPNVIITGEPGVGKTALVDGFALKIAEGEVSDFFKSAKLYQLDLGALLAGASYRGEVEDRLKKVLLEIKRMDKVILFIDEIHMILDTQGGASGVANLLKPELARGEITVIGATTNKEYRMHVEKDAAFVRRFAVLNVEEPAIPKAIKMVTGLKQLFEDHHKFGLEAEAVSETVKMAKRYFPERFLPDSAIDLMDRTMASFRILEDNMADRVNRVKQDLQTFVGEAQNGVPIGENVNADVSSVDVVNTDVLNAQHSSSESSSGAKAIGSSKSRTERSSEQWAEFWEEALNVLSPLAIEDIDLDEPTKDDEPKSWSSYVHKVLALLEAGAKEKKENINSADISKIVAQTTGIPTGKIAGDELQKLANLENDLIAHVIGQDLASEIIAKAVRRSRSGVKDKGKPIGNFFFVGPTGTGKTELAKTLTETLFNDKRNLIRFDMSEFMESHSVSLLKGSPPGYVGYGEGGLLVNEIRSKPYSVVLFDEIEKAHPDVFKLLLQVLDEGHLHDTLGKKGVFTDAVIIFTSNAEQDWVVDEFEKGNIPDETTLRDRMVANKHFRPEFLNRLDAIIPFSPLSKESLLKILDLQLTSLSKLLAEKKIVISLSPDAKNHLVDLGYSPAFGARPLKRVIDTHLGDHISEMIIAGEVTNGETIAIDISGEELVFTVAREKEARFEANLSI